MITAQDDNADIVTFYKNNKINNNFDEVLYKVVYPETIDFYQPYCRDNSIDDKHRLYFHMFVRKKPLLFRRKSFAPLRAKSFRGGEECGHN